MNIEYRKSIKDINWQEVSGLFQQVGWGVRAPDDVRRAFETSSHVRFAFCDGSLAGFGRTVDDGKYYALIVDLVISPEYQNMGIGKTILAELTDQLKSYAFTTLTSAVGKEAFYIKQGWENQKTSFIWPRSEKQRDEHAKSS